MSETQQVEQKKLSNGPAFEILEVNVATGETTVVIQKGIMGPLCNQLKNTSNRRKASSIVKKLGHVLSDCGDIQYGKKIEDTDLNPDLITNLETE